ncbi:MAG: hypothetical protein QM831_27575 [Kofleriaceae bacterium]
MSKRTRLVSLLALAIASPALAQPADPNTQPAPPADPNQPPPAAPTEPTPPVPPVDQTPPPAVIVTPPPVEMKKEEKKDEKPPVRAKWDATLYGFAELDIINDSTQSFSELAGGTAIARPNTYAGDHGQTQYTARNSRLGVKVAAPEVNQMKASAQLEMDFLGNQPTGISEASLYQNATFRFRHLNAKLETPYVDILAGQYWSLFGWQSTFHPNTVAIQGVPGQVYSRVPQLRVGKKIKGGDVDFEIQVAANRPVEKASQTPDGVIAAKISLPKLKAWHNAGSTGSALDDAALGVSVIGRRFTPPNFSATPNHQESKNGYGISVDALIPVIPATKESHAGALTLTGNFVYGAGLADQYTSFSGGVGNAALPNPGMVTPAPTYTSVLDGGLALYTADGTLHPIQWTSILAGAQYYINNMVWLSANYSHMSSGNAKLFGKATAVFDTTNWADGNLFVDVTPAFRVGAEFAWYNQTYVDATDATDYRGQLSFFFIF